MGGHCLPVDPFYLSWRAREYDFVPEFVELAGKMNQAMPYVCVERIVRALNDAGKAVRGSRIVLLGVAYKPGVGDTREIHVPGSYMRAARVERTVTTFCQTPSGAGWL